ncbi:MAG: response regulator [Limnohabitans sp.]
MRQPLHAWTAWLSRLGHSPRLSRSALWLGCLLVIGLHAHVLDLTPESGGDHGAAVAWAVLNHVLSLLSLVGLVMLYQHWQQRQQREMDQHHARLREMQPALAETQNQQQAFIAAVGHELRTPMNGILGLNGQLQQALADSAEDVAAAADIRDAAQALLQVVNALLDLSQLQAGQLTLSPQDVDLPALLQQTVESHRAQDREKGLDCVLQCDADVPHHVRVDGQRLRQVLDTLIGNVLASTRQGRITLRARLSGERVRFEVEDTGVGLGETRQHHRLALSHDDDGQAALPDWAGAGLGLRLCQGLVQLLGGQMEAHSQPGQGDLFCFELPLSPVADPPTEAPLEEPLSGSEPLRILLVDDHAVNLRVAGLQLRQLWPQCEIVSVDNGPEALRQIDARGFDVALVDVAMPGMDGLTLTRMVRERFGRDTAHMPILALTANSLPAEHERCLAAGMDAVLLKPMDPQQLARSISALVRKARA